MGKLISSPWKKPLRLILGVSKVRTLVEGSTVVMQAINTNIEKNLKKVRGAYWLLDIEMISNCSLGDLEF